MEDDSISSHIKTIALRKLLQFLRAFGKIFSGIKPLFKGLFVVFSAIFLFIFNTCILPVYRVYARISRYIGTIFKPAKNKLLYPFVTKYFLHVVIVLVTVFATTTNIYANTNPIVMGSTDEILLASVVGYAVDDEIVEENSYLETIPSAKNYVASAIGTQQSPVAIDDSFVVDQKVDFSVATAGGSALAKPLISSDAVIAANKKRRHDVTTYTVASGDTIGSIAQNFDLKQTTILWANGLTSRSYIRPGQVLNILPVDGIQYTVKSGDSLSKIASTYDVEEDEILDANGMSDASKLAKGLALILPGAQPIQPTIKQSAPPTTKLASANTSGLSKIKDWLAPQEKVVASGGKLLWPTPGKYITQYFSWRHFGLDIDGITGDPLYASEAGTVERAGWGTGYGWHVVIDHGNGMKTRYAHMIKYHVEAGDKVEKGHVIGLMGSTGWSTGSHLHYEVIVNGVRRNPLTYTTR